MPRIRSIKPEFWNDEKLGKESEAVMLTFIGLWNFSDDYGVVRSNPTWLKNQIYPYKDKLRIDAFSAWLDRLSALEVIVPFTFRGESFYYIRMFRKHQKVERPSKARNVPEADLISILNDKGYHFNNSGELAKHSVSVRGVFGEQSPMEEDKEEDKEEEGDIAGEPAKKYSNEELLWFENFNKWLKEHTPTVGKMERPFSIDEYLKLRKAMKRDKMLDLLKRMDNWKPLLRKNKSAYQTILNWDKNNWGNDNQPPEAKVEAVIKGHEERFKKTMNGGQH